MSSMRKPAISTSINNTKSDHATAVCQFRTSYSGKKIAAMSLPKQLPSLLSSQQHFAGIFASEPMRLSEIDHLSILTTHAFYIFPPVNGAPLACASRERGAPLSHFYNKFCEIFTLVSSSFHFLLYM